MYALQGRGTFGGFGLDIVAGVCGDYGSQTQKAGEERIDAHCRVNIGWELLTIFDELLLYCLYGTSMAFYIWESPNQPLWLTNNSHDIGRR